jgi:hypothetical protein
MKKIKGDKPSGVIMHRYMKISQGNSLCSYLYLKQAKMSCFCFIFSLFSSIKSENRRAEQVLPQRGRLAPVGGERRWGKEVGG